MHAMKKVICSVLVIHKKQAHTYICITSRSMKWTDDKHG